jgi:diacylglycerol kinase (ATP)
VSARAFAIVNPAAGAGRSGRAWPRLVRILTHSGFALEWAATSRPGEATDLARRAVAAGHTLVVAVGGDGTVNEVVNGITRGDGTPLASLGILATGRGRDVCRNFGIPRSPVSAARALANGREITADLGLVRFENTQRFFAIATGVGFDADVARRAQGRRGAGTVPYLIGVLQALGRHRPRSMTVSGDVTWSGAGTMVVVANGPFYGGGMNIAPAADPKDGVLDVIVIGDIGRVELVRWLPALYRGTHVKNRHVATARARALRIDAREMLPVHVDGEPIASTPIDVTICAGALRLRV